jgi:hypothetical protein
MDNITFNDLPQVVSRIENKLEKIEKLVLQLQLKKVELEPSEQWMNIAELCAYHPNKPARQTVYGWVHSKTIPFHKGPKTRTLKFLKSEIDNWLKSDKVPA